MTWIRVFIHRLRGLFFKRKLDQELEDEIRAHIEMQVEDNLRQGMSPDEARYQAMRKFGGVEQIKESYRDRRSLAVVDSALWDLRYALRMLRRSPGFTAVAVLTLALGIGANTAIFSLFEGAVLAPLPYRDAERLVVVWQSNPQTPRIFPSAPDFQDWRRNARSFEQMAAILSNARDLTNPGAPEHLSGREISSGFFSMLGVKLTAGREFSSQEDQRGGNPVVIISNRLWQDRFGASREALGRSVTLDGIDHTIIGVLPIGFEFGDAGEADVYTPFWQSNPVTMTDRNIHPGFLCVARLKNGVTIDQAKSEMATIQTSLNQLYPSTNRGLGAEVIPLKQEIVGDAGTTLLLLMGAVGLVLLIACANIANLLLARSEARSGEFAIRMALGASRMRLAYQLIIESLLLSFGGGVLGLAIAKWAVIPSLAAVPANLPRSAHIGVNISVLLFTFGLTIVVGILFGMAPVMKSSTSDIHVSLKAGGRGVLKGRHNIQRGMVIAQMALTMVLLAGAMLMFRTVRHLYAVDPGFNSQRIITFKAGLSPSITKNASTWRTAYQQLAERIRQIPGVQGADFTYIVPLARQANSVPFWVGPRETTSTAEAPQLTLHWTGPEYLKTMEIPQLQGRFLTLKDNLQSEPAIVIDSVLAQIYFHDKDPLGQTITIPRWGQVRIVGVVGHVRRWGLVEDKYRIQNQAYASIYQLPDEWMPVFYPDLTMVVRAKVDSAALLPAIKDVVYGAGDNQPVYDIRTMQEIMTASIPSQRFHLFLLGAFALLALLLAAVGIYGVMTYMTTERTHEIGVRMALGADRWSILRMVVGGGLRLALIGVAIGLAAALILGRILSNFSHLLYGVHPWDPLTLIAISLVLICATLLACYLPAHRAAGIDPMIALRHE
jgi:putative ABC transport system permease protein